jgi:predicted PurR-regulated permease PerM
MTGRPIAKSANENDQRLKPRRTFVEMRLLARIALALGLLIVALWMSLDFLAPMSWAVVIALTVWPAYRRFASRIADKPSEIAAPLLFTLIVGIVLFLPVGLAIHQAALEGQNLVHSLAHIREHGVPVPEWLPSIPLGEQGARWWQTNLSDPSGFSELLGSNLDKEAQAAWARTLGGSSPASNVSVWGNSNFSFHNSAERRVDR